MFSFGKNKKKKSCKASEGTKKLRDGHKQFREFLAEIRESAKKAQEENGEWLKYDKQADG